MPAGFLPQSAFLAPADLDDFYRLATDPDVIRGCRRRVARGGSAGDGDIFKNTTRYGCWAARLKAEDRFVGFAGLKFLEDVGEVDIGYRFFKEYWGQGLATEACRGLIAYGFETLRLPRILGIVDRDNAASIRVLEKTGFRFEKFAAYRGSDTAWYFLDRPDAS